MLIGRAAARRRLARSAPTRRMAEVSTHRPGDAGRRPGRGDQRHVGARQQSPAGQCRRRLRDPQGLGRAPQGKGQDLRSIVQHLIGARRASAAGRPRLRAGAAADPGHRQCRRLQMQVEQQDGSFDYAKLQNATDDVIEQAQHAVGARQLVTTFRAGAPQVGSTSTAPRRRRSTCRSATCSPRCRPIVGSTYVNQFNKFGQSLPGLCPGRFASTAPSPTTSCKLKVRRPATARWCRSARWPSITPVPGPSLISLYNLYPVGGDRRRAGAGLQLGRGASTLMDQIADSDPAARHRLRLDGDVLPGEARRQPDLSTCSRWPCCWSISCLAGQYESWIAPLGRDPRRAAGAARHRRSRSTGARPRQQPLHPDRPDAADRARRQERHPDRRGARETRADRRQGRSSRRRSRRRARASGRS